MSQEVWIAASPTERKSVSWLLSLYTSEFFFLFHLPLFVELPEGVRKPPKANSLSLASRQGRIAYIRNGRHYPHPWFQLGVFICRSALNLTWLVFIFYDLRASPIWEGTHLHHISRIFKLGPGWYCFFASTVLYVISYLHQRYHLTREEADNPGSVSISVPLYWLSHLSIINFSLDFPSGPVPSTQISRALICIINAIALCIVAFVTIFEEPFIEAWDCYREGTPITKHEYGLCPMYLGRTVSPVCDQPHIRCGRERVMAHSEMQYALSIAQMFLSASFAIYLISINTKITYWRTLLEKATSEKQQ